MYSQASRHHRSSFRFMLTKRIIPCLDVNAGRVVKGVHFLQLRDAGDPGEVAARYEADVDLPTPDEKNCLMAVESCALFSLR